MDAQEAKDALDQISVTKDEVVQRWKAPKGYYAILGLAMWLNIVAITLPFPWGLIASMVTVVTVGVVLSWYMRVVGMWAFADIRGKGSWIFWMMVIVLLAAFAAAALIDNVRVAAVLGGIVFVTWSVFGPIWDRAARPAGA
ncbi:MAG: hypothetical protein QM705_06130 [Ancrocorticia sp.]